MRSADLRVNSDPIVIRPAQRNDEEAIWRIFHAVVAPGDTYVLSPETPREEVVIQARSPFMGVKIANISPALADEMRLEASDRKSVV